MPFLLAAFLAIGSLVVAVVTLQALVAQGSFRMQELARKNGELSIDYRMSRADGTWQVVDTIVDGVSLVASYRAQVMRIRHRSTHRELIALMRSLVGKSTNPETCPSPELGPARSMDVPPRLTG